MRKLFQRLYKLLCYEWEIRVRNAELFKTVILGETPDGQHVDSFPCVYEGCFRICAHFNKKEEAITAGISKAIYLLIKLTSTELVESGRNCLKK